MKELKKESERRDCCALSAEQKHVMDTLNQTHTKLQLFDKDDQSEFKKVSKSSLDGFAKKLQQLNKELGCEQCEMPKTFMGNG